MVYLTTYENPLYFTSDLYAKSAILHNINNQPTIAHMFLHHMFGPVAAVPGPLAAALGLQKLSKPNLISNSSP